MGNIYKTLKAVWCMVYWHFIERYFFILSVEDSFHYTNITVRCADSEKCSKSYQHTELTPLLISHPFSNTNEQR